MNSNSAFSPEFSSAEAQRLYYLQALGISTCYPRFVLPGAAPSSACILPEADIAPEPATKLSRQLGSALASLTGARPAVVEAVSPPINELPAARAEASVSPPVTPATSKPAKVQEKAVGAEEQLQFQLLLLQADNNLAVCSQIPYLAKGVLSNKEQVLLQNMLHWLACPLQANIGARRFSWPLPGLGAVSRMVAGKSLYSFMEQARQELGFSRLLLMGSNSIECLEEYQQAGVSSAPDWQLFTTHSLSEMLAFPELKKTVFQHLLPLHAQLAAQSR